MTIVRRRLIIQGKVQGVTFRANCVRVAREVGASGWVRNLGDGRVEAVIEGDAKAVDALTAWCYVGPPEAEISSVAEQNEDPEGVEGFLIR